MSAHGYAELVATSNFSFLRGASHPQELVAAAHALGHAAIGVADHNTLAGVVRAHAEALKLGQRFLVGARLVFEDGFPDLVCYPTDRAAYGRLTKLLSLGQRRVGKGCCSLSYADLADAAEGQVFIAAPGAAIAERFARDLRRLSGDCPGQVYLAAAHRQDGEDARRLAVLAALARAAKAPLIATADVLYHDPARRPLQDVLTCIREKCRIADAGLRLQANAERHLKAPAEMARLFAAYPEALAHTLEIVARCDFSLASLRYEYPDEPIPPGKTPQRHLEDLTWEGAAWRYPAGVPAKVRAQLVKELAFIAEQDIPQYFLTVHDIVRWAREQKILCQGRGSAANSAVCFCLGVTAVDPDTSNLLFERFISKERNEPPDIDVDFEHERREEVIQYIYNRYGRERAAICATVIHYRPRSAIRDVGKALGLSEDITAALAGTVWGSWGDGVPDDHIRQAGLDPANAQIRRAVDIATDLLGFPRHLSQHVGGFVLTQNRLDETVPIGNAAMADRTFIEWDKDDIDTLKLMKVDVLALGMLTCLRRAMDFLTAHGLREVSDIADLPGEDPTVYAMLSKGDSVGVFQVESRAQMSMLPRLKPQTFYDLVIEVAIVRPGPIQGNMVHPYLKRRNGEKVVFPSPSPAHGPADELESILGRTLGVPLFQEQAMSIAITAAAFTAEEANGLRRAMATFRNVGTMHTHKEKFVSRMIARGYDPDFATRCFQQIEGFGSYGFPESHAASFAKLVYASAWIKCHFPAAFCAAILNSLPMGFYEPAQLVRDAREHGVEVRPPDIFASDWDCTLEASRTSHGGKAVRLGLRLVKGLAEKDAQRLIAARTAGASSLEALARRAGVANGVLERLADAAAFDGVKLDRRNALWRLGGLKGEDARDREAPLFASLETPPAETVTLPAMRTAEHVAEDYRTFQLSLRKHPVAFFRRALAGKGALRATDLDTAATPSGAIVRVAGLVLNRQRPGTAKGVMFATLEDETGVANIIAWPDFFEANRKVLMTSGFLLVEGRAQKESGVIHVVATRVEDLTHHLARLRDPQAAPDAASVALQRSRDFH